jgi:chaperone modulatory protein CbpM
MTDERNLPQFTGVIVEEIELTLAEVSRGCAVHAEYVVELVQEGVLSPRGGEPQRWRFGGGALRRVNTALRLQRDLGLNLEGVALAMQLLDEVSELRARLTGLGIDV